MTDRRQVNTVGPYMVDKIVLEAKRIVFVHEPLAKAEATTPLGIITSVSVHSLKAAKKARILCFPRTESFDARMYLSHFIHIDKPRHIEIHCASGSNEITRAEVRLKSASAGLRLRTANSSVPSGEVGITDKTKPGLVVIGAMAANSSATLKIPYDMETILQDLNIKIEVDYYTANSQSHYFSSSTIPVDLPLDVNVHDHFKKDTLLSKFNIKTANHIPLQLLDVELQNSDEFEVHAPRKSKRPSYIFAKQPVAVTYRITKKATQVSEKRQSKNATTGSLALSVEYRCLNEDVQDRLCKMFESDVAQGSVHRLGRLLVNTFADRLEHKILPYQFERVAMLENVDMGEFEDMGWSECLDSLPEVIRDDTKAWLRKWHLVSFANAVPFRRTQSNIISQSNKIIHLTENPGQTSIAPPSPHPPRRMIITVSIPQTHILHTASLKLVSQSTTTIATAGQPLQATLRISHTRRWASPPTSPSLPIEFIYTLEGSPDTWLIAGQRRGHFSAHEDQVHEWPISLIPLKPGVTLLPNVDIRMRPDKTKEDAEVNCEIDYLSYGETVTVVPDVKRSTVGVGDMNKGRETSVVWLESAGVGG
jgi:hypothetical protein